MALRNQIPFVFVFALFLCTIVSSQTLKQSRDSRCNGVSVSSRLYSERELQELRNSTRNPFYARYIHIIDFYSGEKSAAVFMKTFDWEIGLYIALMCLILISVVLFILSIEYWHNLFKKSKSDLYFNFSLAMIVLFVALFIAELVFIGLSVSSEQKAICQLYNVPSSVVYGSPQASHGQEFIGYYPFAYFVSNYTANIPAGASLTGELKKIIDTNPPDSSQAAINALLEFYDKFKTNSTTNSTGESAIPNSILNLERTVNLDIESEFEKIDLLALKIRSASTEARFLSDQNYVPFIRQGLNDIRNYLNRTVVEIESFFQKYLDNAMQNDRYVIAGFWTFFALSIVLIITAGFLVYILAGLKKGRFKSWIDIIQIVLIVFGFFVLVYGVGVAILMAGTAAVSALCEYLSLVNRGGWSAINEFSNHLNSESAKLIQNCLSFNSTGNLMTLVGSTDYIQDSYNRLARLIDGPKQLTQWYSDNPSNGTFKSEAIPRQISNWDDILLGVREDHSGIKDALKQLNDLTSCDGVQFVFSSVQCPEAAKCFDISSKSEFSPASCVIDPSLSKQIFTRLKNYIDSQRDLFTAMSNELKTTVQQRIEKAGFTLYSISAEVQKFAKEFDSTLKVLKEYKNDIAGITKCTNLKVEMQIFEQHLCFEFGRRIYILLVLSCIATVVLFITMWCLCLSVRSFSDLYHSPSLVSRISLTGLRNRELIPRV